MRLRVLTKKANKIYRRYLAEPVDILAGRCDRGTVDCASGRMELVVQMVPETWSSIQQIYVRLFLSLGDV
jgi:hypothetical protein